MKTKLLELLTPIFINHELSSFSLPPKTHPNSARAKENHQAFSRALRVDLVKDKTIIFSKAPK